MCYGTVHTCHFPRPPNCIGQYTNLKYAIIFPNIDEYGLLSDKNQVDLKDGELLNLIDDEVKKINRSLETYKRIGKFSIKLEEFPKTTTRKIKRFLFRDLDLNNVNTYL